MAERRLVNPMDLPEEAVSAAPRVTLSGKHRAVVEYHRGLLGYEKDYIEVASGEGTVRILGQELVLDAMDSERIVVRGRIAGVEYG